MPLPQIFGSEELSSRSGSIKERSPAPFLALGKEDAQGLGVKEGDSLKISFGRVAHTLPVTLQGGLPKGVAGWPQNLSTLPSIDLPAYARIEK